MNKRTVLTLVALLVVVSLAVVAVRPSNPVASVAPQLAAPGLDEGTTPDADGVPLLDVAPTFDISAPIVGEAVAAVSFDGDVRSLPQTGPETKTVLRELELPRNLRDAVTAPDPVVQSADGPLAMPAASVSFKGLYLQAWGAGWPPDTHGDVGPNHYVQAVNTSIGIYSKTGTQLAAFTFDTLFAGTGTPCDANNRGDPYVLYDAVSGRWIVTDFAWSSTSGPFYECIAVSKTADPVSGGWWFYGFVASSNALHDYPKLGVWADGIYMSANMFLNASSYNGVKVWAFNRDDLISGAPLRNVAFSLGTAYASLLPSNVRGAMPPAGAPAYFASRTSSALRLWKFSVNWANQASSTFTGPTSISVASYSTPSGRVPQKSGERLDTLGDRLMSALQYRNIGGVESLWVNHTVAVGSTSTGVRWYEVRGMSGTPAVYQQGTYAPDTKYRWMGSLAVDKQGNMAVGYSVSSKQMFPAINYAGRLVGDALGQLAQGEATLIAGTGAQSGGYNRWGDYASMSVDPSNDCTFWFTTEYYETTGNNWQTRIGAFKYPGCN